MKKQVALRKVKNGPWLEMAVPYEFVRLFDLRVKDLALWELEGNKITLSFFAAPVSKVPEVREEAVVNST